MAVSVKYVDTRIVETLMTCHKSPAKYRGKYAWVFSIPENWNPAEFREPNNTVPNMKSKNTKNNKLAIIIPLGLALAALTVRAQDTNAVASTTTNEAPPTASIVSAPPEFQPFTLGVQGGFPGPGVKADWRFANHFGAGAAFDYLSYSYNGEIKGINYKIDLRLMSEPLTLNWYPWKRSSFHIGAGVLLNENHLTGSANGNNLNFGGTTYIGHGTANLDIKQQLVDPYVSIGGNIYFDKAHHWSLGGELGAFYTGEPRVDFTANTTPPASQQSVQSEQNEIKHYAKDAEVLPVLELSLNYSF
jgi:hypothetical protein